LLGFWQQSQRYRKRFGTVDGLRVANDMANVGYRHVDARFVAVRIPGWHQPIWLRPETADLWVFDQLILGGELDIPLDPPPTRIIDGGANIGLASRIFAERWPKASIVAVEMEAGNFAALRQNTQNTPAIELRHAALWNERASVGVTPSEEYRELGFRASAAGSGPRVPTFALEDLLDELGWDHVGLVKLDIEGAEMQVLETAPRWIDRVDHLIVELHEQMVPGVEAAFRRVVNPRDWSVRQHGEYQVASRTR
jgi:FkbM family methyltransferase